MKHTLLALFIVLSFTSFANAGGYVGNGGDTIVCRNSKDNPLNGTYILDYVAGINEGLFTLIDDGTQGDISKEIYTLLQTRLPEAAEDLSHFMRAARRQIFAKPDFDSIYTWASQRQGVTEISDEFLTSKIPANCLDSNGKPMATQAVVREERDESTFYYYDFNQLTALKNQSALQYSMLMIHEWLWYYSSNANIVRQINSYLHSKEFRADSAAQTVNVLTKLGFNMTRKARVPDPSTFRIDINSCDLSTFVAPVVKAPKRVGVSPLVINHTDCGFDVYSDSYGRPDQMIYDRIVDANRYGRTEFETYPTLPGYSSMIRLSYQFDANGNSVRPNTTFIPLMTVIEDDSF